MQREVDSAKITDTGGLLEWSYIRCAVNAIDQQAYRRPSISLMLVSSSLDILGTQRSRGWRSFSAAADGTSSLNGSCTSYCSARTQWGDEPIDTHGWRRREKLFGQLDWPDLAERLAGGQRKIRTAVFHDYGADLAATRRDTNNCRVSGVVTACQIQSE